MGNTKFPTELNAIVTMETSSYSSNKYIPVFLTLIFDIFGGTEELCDIRVYFPIDICIYKLFLQRS